jgi:hypothetical protein
MAGEELVQRWVRRLRQEVPGVMAVFLAGSHVHAGTYAALLSHPRATYLGDGGLRAYVAQLLP